MPPVQKAALALLPRLAPTHAPQLYPEYIFTIVRLVRPEHVVELWEEQAAATGTVKQPPGQVAQAKFALTSAFLEKVGCGGRGFRRGARSKELDWTGLMFTSRAGNAGRGLRIAVEGLAERGGL